MFPIGRVERHGCGFDEHVVISKVRYATIGDDLGVSRALDFDGFLHGHFLLRDMFLKASEVIYLKSLELYYKWRRHDAAAWAATAPGDGGVRAI